MSDLERILALWRELDSAGSDFVLATIVAVDGPSYRKPGTMMLLTGDGRRAGAISGGCLEAQVACRAWWLTANGPCIQAYSTAEDDGDRPFGSGCGGVVSLLLERRATAQALLAAVQSAFKKRSALAVATVLEGEHIAQRAFCALGDEPSKNSLQTFANRSMQARKSIECKIELDASTAKAWADYRPARPGLAIFSAGDDARPLVRLGKELGWFVSVADGRSHLATRERFPSADELSTLPMHELPAHLPVFASIHRDDAAIVMTHSFEQDSKILACLLRLEEQPSYIGVLGPQRRTRELLVEAGRMLQLPEARIASQADRWLDKLFAPTGLDLGAESPETIALSILAEIQKIRSASTALPLCTVRSATLSSTP
jgi:xanthine/CO dehydrogenase XdhC/CoxF family maturation factor